MKESLMTMRSLTEAKARKTSLMNTTRLKITTRVMNIKIDNRHVKDDSEKEIDVDIHLTSEESAKIYVDSIDGEIDNQATERDYISDSDREEFVKEEEN